MAAGLGFKTFTTGEVLTAADTNGYLMQGVLVFASSAARAAAITSPQEGQYSYLKDTDALEYYSGSAWVGAPVGDITGVTAGTGISGGGTSGTVTVSIDTAVTVDKTTAQTLTNKTLTSPALTTPTISTATTNGDLLYGTGSGALTRLGIGSSAQVLTVASGVPSWATAAGAGAVVQITDTTLSSAAADITFSSIAATYNHLMIIISGQCSSGSVNGTDLKVQLNSDTGNNYRTARNTKYATAGATVTIEGSGASASLDMGNLWCGTATVSSTAAAQMTFPNYKGTTLQKTMIFTGGANSDAPGAGAGIGMWANTAAITTIKIFSAGGNLNTGTRATLYGWT